MRRLVILTVMLCVFMVHGADLRYRQLRTDDGLAGNTVRDIAQDSHGFMWMATLNGLSRWDGIRFVNFTPNSHSGLADGRIYNLHEDSTGHLWIGTSSRIFSCYDLQLGRFIDYGGGSYSHLHIAKNGDIWLWHDSNGALRVRMNSDRTLKSTEFSKEKGNLPDSKISSISESADGRILISTGKGIAVINDGRKESILLPGLQIMQTIDSGKCKIAIDDRGNIYDVGKGTRKVASLPDGISLTDHFIIGKDIYLLTSAGAWRFDTVNKTIVREKRLSIDKGRVTYDNRQRPWIFNGAGKLTYYSDKDRTFHTLDLIPSSILGNIDHERYNIVEDRDGTIWISTYGNGLFTFDMDKGITGHITAEDGPTTPLKSNYVRFMMEDKDGGIWIASEYSGVTHLWKDRMKTVYLYPDTTKLMSRANSVRMLYMKTDGGYFISTRNGNLYKSTSIGTLQPVDKYKGFMIYCMLQEVEVDWIGTRGSGLIVGDKEYRKDNSSLPDDNIYFIHPDKKGRKWIGTFGGGLALAGEDNRRGLTFSTFFKGEHGIDQQRCAVEDMNGRIWIGTSGGLLTLMPDSLLKDPRAYRVYSHDNGTFPGNEVRCLTFDRNGNLWVGTSDAGLVCCAIDRKGNLKISKQYTTNDGLSNGSVQSLVEDRSGNIWIGTEYGLSKFNRRRESIVSYILSANSLSNVYSENCAGVAANGTVLLGTNCGLAVIDPKDTDNNADSATPIFIRISVNGFDIDPSADGSSLSHAIDYEKEIRLRHYQNSFTLEFSMMDHTEDGQDLYVYKLEGYDAGWSQPASATSASYKYLSPGKYIFRVRPAGGNDDSESSIVIRIMPQWWQTWWAYTIYLILIAASGYWIYRFFTKKHHFEQMPSPAVEAVEELDTDTTESDMLSKNNEFLDRINAVIEENIPNPDFSMDEFASKLNISRAIFFRKVKELTGMSPNDYLKQARISRASRLLKKESALSVSEIAYRVGFNDSLYFSKCFKAQVGLSPSQFRKEEH